MRALYLLLLLASPAGAMTYFGSASNPSDYSTNTTTPVVITPPASMTSGQLIYVGCEARSASATAASISETGGQSWTATGVVQSASGFSATFLYAIFDGTWDADPSFNVPGNTSESCQMHVFTPTSGYQFSLTPDVALSNAAYSLPAAPYDVLVSAITPPSARTVVINFWANVSVVTWTIQSSGWTNAGNAQYRNLDGSDLSASYAYKFLTSSTSSGSVTNRMSGGFSGGRTTTIAFKETAIATNPPVFSGTVPNFSFVEDTAIASTCLASYFSTGGAVVSYALTGTPPASISFNTSTACFSGTPPTPGVSAGLVATAANTDGSAPTGSFSITITAAAAVISVPPAITSETSTTFTGSVTTTGSATISRVACIDGQTPPTIAQAIAADCTGNVDAPASSASAINGAGSFTLGPLTNPIYDIYVTDGTTLYTLANRELDCQASTVCQTLTSIGSGSPIETLNVTASPDIAAGDYIRCPSVTTPGSFPPTISAAGHVSYIGNAARQLLWNCQIYDTSVGAWHASDLDLTANGVSPSCSEPFEPVFRVGVYFSFDLNDLCNDLDGDPLDFSLTSGSLSTGITLDVVTGILSGTPSVESEAGDATTFTATDIAGATDTQLATFFPITSWAITDCTTAHLDASVCVPAIFSLTRQTTDVQSTYAYSASVAANGVISQSPVAGAAVAPGDSVSLIVSLGAYTLAATPTAISGGYSLSITSAETRTCYAVSYNRIANRPTAAQIRVGTDGDGNLAFNAGSVAVSANVAGTIQLTSPYPVATLSAVCWDGVTYTDVVELADQVRGARTPLQDIRIQ